MFVKNHQHGHSIKCALEEYLVLLASGSVVVSSVFSAAVVLPTVFGEPSLGEGDPLEGFVLFSGAAAVVAGLLAPLLALLEPVDLVSSSSFAFSAFPFATMFSIG